MKRKGIALIKTMKQHYEPYNFLSIKTVAPYLLESQSNFKMNLSNFSCSHLKWKIGQHNAIVSRDSLFRDGLKPSSQLSIHHQVSHSTYTKLYAFISDLFPSLLSTRNKILFIS